MRYASDGAIVIKGNHDEALETRRAPFLHERGGAAGHRLGAALPHGRAESLSRRASAVREEGAHVLRPRLGGDAAALGLHRQSFRRAQEPQRGRRDLHFLGARARAGAYARISGEQATEFRPLSGAPVPLGAQRRWLALVGSVGQPRDGRPAAGYALFDQDQDQLTYFRVPYDHLSAAQKIRAAGAFEGLAYRVEKGV